MKPRTWNSHPGRLKCGCFFPHEKPDVFFLFLETFRPSEDGRYRYRYSVRRGYHEPRGGRGYVTGFGPQQAEAPPPASPPLRSLLPPSTENVISLTPTPPPRPLRQSRRRGHPLRPGPRRVHTPILPMGNPQTRILWLDLDRVGNIGKVHERTDPNHNQPTKKKGKEETEHTFLSRN